MSAGKVYSPEAMAILRSKMSYLAPMAGGQAMITFEGDSLGLQWRDALKESPKEGSTVLVRWCDGEIGIATIDSGLWISKDNVSDGDPALGWVYLEDAAYRQRV